MFTCICKIRLDFASSIIICNACICCYIRTCRCVSKGAVSVCLRNAWFCFSLVVPLISRLNVGNTRRSKPSVSSSVSIDTKVRIAGMSLLIWQQQVFPVRYSRLRSLTDNLQACSLSSCFRCGTTPTNAGVWVLVWAIAHLRYSLNYISTEELQSNGKSERRQVTPKRSKRSLYRLLHCLVRLNQVAYYHRQYLLPSLRGT